MMELGPAKRTQNTRWPRLSAGMAELLCAIPCKTFALDLPYAWGYLSRTCLASFLRPLFPEVTSSDEAHLSSREVS